jgi:hypothetical protein
MRLLLVVLLIAACRESPPPGKPKTGSGSQGSAIAADPWKAPDAGAKAPETPEQRKARAEKALARVNEIQPKLAKLRGLPFDHPVPTAYQTADDFKAFLRREIAKDLPPEKSAKMSTAFFHIGLLQTKVDLATALEQTMSSQAAAYYDPAAKKFFMVMVPDSDILLDTISAHELTHGLQDQHFDVTKFYTIKPPNDDVQYARQFVVEGDATFTMFLYMAAEATKTDAVQAAMLRMMRGQIEQFAQMDIAAYGEMMKQQAAAMPDMDPELKKSMEAMDQLPPMIIAPLIDTYMKGALVVFTAYERGGWKTVDALFKTPPTSTEQVLHPTTKLFPKRDEPQQVTLPKVFPAGPSESDPLQLRGEVVNSNVLGELLWSIYFSLWTPDKKAEPSEGWDGDRYVVVKRTDGSLVGYHATIWDSADDAKQFAAAYEASFDKRFPAKDRKHAVKTEGTKVFILDGDDDAKLLAKLIKGTKFAP